MSDSLLDNTKKELRAILESSGQGIQLREISKEFRGLMGREVPYRQLGFGGLEDFLWSIPDTIRIVGNPPVLQVVSDKATEHLERLVRTQKKTTPKSMAARRRITLPKPRPASPLKSGSAYEDNRSKMFRPSYQTSRYQHQLPHQPFHHLNGYQNQHFGYHNLQFGYQNQQHGHQKLPNQQRSYQNQYRPTQQAYVAPPFRNVAVQLNAPKPATGSWHPLQQLAVAPPPSSSWQPVNVEATRPQPTAASYSRSEPTAVTETAKPVRPKDEPSHSSPERPSLAFTSAQSARPNNPGINSAPVLTSPSLPTGSKTVAKMYSTGNTERLLDAEPPPRYSAPMMQLSSHRKPEDMLVDIKNLVQRHCHEGVPIKRFAEHFWDAFNYAIFPMWFHFNRFEELFESLPDLFMLRFVGSESRVYPTGNRTATPPIRFSTTPNFDFGNSASPAVNPFAVMPPRTLAAVRRGGAPPGFTPRPPGFDKPTVPECNRDWATWDADNLLNQCRPTSGTVPAESAAVGRQGTSDAARKLSDEPSRLSHHSFEAVNVPTNVESPGRLVSPQNLLSPRSPALPSPGDDDRPVVAAPRPSDVTDGVKKIFLEILAKKPGGLPAPQLLSEYRVATGHSFNCQEYGFHTPLEMVSSMSGVFKIQRSHRGGQWVVLPADNLQQQVSDDRRQTVQLSDRVSPNVSNRSPARVAPKVDIMLQKKIMQVLCSCTNGANISDFKKFYFDFFNEEFMSNETDFTIEEMFLSFSDIVSLDYVNGGKNKIIAHAKPEGRRLLFLSLPDPAVDSDHHASRRMPKDAVCDGRSFNPQANLLKLSVGLNFEVIVVNVVHPSSFYIHLRGDDESEALKSLMEELKIFYKNPDNSLAYNMPTKMMKPTQVCAALYDDLNWYRATIISVNKAIQKVEVYYDDFGGTRLINKDQIKLLSDTFMTLASQGILAKLARVKPTPGLLWSSAAIARFTKLALEKPAIATVIDNTDFPLNLGLCDTSEDKDIYFGDTLVVEKLAAFLDESEVHIHCNRAGDGDAYGSGIGTPPYSVNSQNINVGCNRDAWSAASSDASLNKLQQTLMETLRIAENQVSYNLTPVTLLTTQIHLVNIEGINYVPTFEISSMLWQYDALWQMVSVCPLVVKFLYVDETSHGDLYANLLKLPGVVNKCKLTLCPVLKVPDIFLFFAQEKEHYYKAAKELTELFK